MEIRKPITMSPIRSPQPQPQQPKVSQQEVQLMRENQELKKENQELRIELEAKITKEKLLSEGEFRYQLLVQLNSIAEQINALAHISSDNRQEDTEEYQEQEKRDLLEGILPEPQQEEEDDEDYDEPIKVPSKTRV